MSFAAAGRKKEPFDFQFKAHVIGTKVAGKADIISCLVGAAALSHRGSMVSVGMDFHTKMFTAEDGARVKLQLWDSACQAAYRHAPYAYLRGSRAVVFAYNCKDRDSFDFIANWILRLDDTAYLCCAIIATNEGTGPVVVSEAEGMYFANAHSMLHSSCSGTASEKADQVAQVFQNIVNTVRNKEKNLPTVTIEKTAKNQTLTTTPSKASNGCIVC